MAKKPELGKSTSDIVIGSGALGYQEEKLAALDPTSYYYQKFKRLQHEDLDANMWAEAAKRGESAYLIDLINERDELRKTGKDLDYSTAGEAMKFDIKSQQTTPTKMNVEGINLLNKYKSYGMPDYDTYMLAMSIPTLDDTEKKDRTVETDKGPYSFGQYTDKEWAIEMLQSHFETLEGKLIEERKANDGFWGDIAGTIGSIATRLAAGITDAITGIFNIGEGIVNMFANWGGDDNIGSRFLWAFSNDGPNAFEEAAQEIEKQLCFYYNAETGEYSDFGKVFTGMVQSIGEMLPSMLLTAGLGTAAKGASTAAKGAQAVAKGQSFISATTKATKLANLAKIAGQTAFHASMFSNKIKDTVTSAAYKGISYKQLNSGEVVSHALLQTAAQWGIEYGLGKVLGFFSTQDKLIGIGTDVATRTMTKVGATEAAAFGIHAIRVAKEAAKEGLEEVLQDMSDSFVSMIYGGFQTNLQEVYTNAVEQQFTIENLVQSFIAGAATSVVIGGIADMKYIPKSQRMIGTNADGSAFRLGQFQTINLAQALETMNEWNRILNDRNSSEEVIRNTALKMSTAINTLGSVFRHLGVQDTFKTNGILLSYLNDQAKKEEVKRLSEGDYATNLFKEFENEYRKAGKTFAIQELDKLKNAIKKNENKLKESGVSKILSIFTKFKNGAKKQDASVAEAEENVTSKVTSAMDSMGINQYLEVNGANIWIRSEDIVFISKDLMERDELKPLLENDAFQSILNTTYDVLSEQLGLDLLSELAVIYSRATGHKITNVFDAIDDAIKAMMFDQEFYSKAILYIAEKGLDNYNIINIVTHLDTIVRKRGAQLLAKGKLSQDVFNTLLDKVRSNMRRGIVYYATQYGYLDLNKINENVLSKEDIDNIRNHPNVLYTEMLTDLYNAKGGQLNENYLIRFDKLVDNFVSNDIQKDTLKTKIRSNDKIQRLDAELTLNLLMDKNITIQGKNKSQLTYLPTNPAGTTLSEEYTNIAAIFGVTNIRTSNLSPLMSFVNNTPDINSISPELFSIVVGGKYNLLDRDSRLLLVKNVVDKVSKGALYFTDIGIMMEVIPITKFLKSEYLTDYQSFVNKVLSGEISNIDQVTNMKVYSTPIEAKTGEQLRNDPRFENELIPDDYVAFYSDKHHSIFINPTNWFVKDVLNYTLGHELAHAAQNIAARRIATTLFNTNKDQQLISGGASERFVLIRDEELYKIDKWINDNLPAFSYMTRNQTIDRATYSAIDGEFKARTMCSNIAIDTAFTYIEKLNGKATTWGQLKLNRKEGDLYLRPPNGRVDGSDDIDLTIDTKKAELLKEYVAQKGISKLEEPDLKVRKLKEDETLSKKKLPNRVFISNKTLGAKDTNLKNFVGQQMHPGIRDFVVQTSGDNFNKLPKAIRTKINNGTLTMWDISKIVATASKLNDYTFKTIAKTIYKNEELAKLTFDEMIKLQDNIIEFAALARTIPDEDLDVMTVDELFTRLEEVRNDPELKEKFGEQAVLVQKLISSKMDQLGKVTKSVPEEVLTDPRQLNLLFFNNYKGTLDSLKRINNIGKLLVYRQQTDTLSLEESRAQEATGAEVAGVEDPQSWSARKQIADIDYTIDDDAARDIESIDRNIKEEFILNNIVSNLERKLLDLPESQRKIAGAEAIKRIAAARETLATISEEALNARYLKALESETTGKAATDSLTKTETAEEKKLAEKRAKKKIKKTVTDELNTYAEYIKGKLAGKKIRYNWLSDLTKKYFDWKTKKLSPEYAKLSDTEKAELLKQMKADNEMLKTRSTQQETRKARQEARKEYAEKLAKEKAKREQEKKPTKTFEKKVYTTTVKNQTFTIESDTEANTLVKQLLNTAWNKTRMSTVQELQNNEEADVANGKEFFEQNVDAIMSVDLRTAEEAARFFANSEIQRTSGKEARKFQAIKLYYLSYILGQTKAGGLFEGMNHNVIQQIETRIKEEVSQAGMTLGIWNRVMGLIDPFASMANAHMEVDGVEIPKDLKNELFDGLKSTKFDDVRKAELNIMKFVDANRTGKKSLARRIISYRSMAMLSSPVTWLRNKVSNMAVKRLNSLADKIGARLFSSKTYNGQLKLDTIFEVKYKEKGVKVTEPAVEKFPVQYTKNGKFKLTGNVDKSIVDFILKEFLDNGMFDTLVNNISKYNVSDALKRDYWEKKHDKNKATREAIMTSLVLKSMYGEYFNKITFNSKFMNNIHSWLMKVMSDDVYIKESAIKFFGKILAERNYDLSYYNRTVDSTEVGEATATKLNAIKDNIMKDFAVSLGMALNEYMHSDNIFNKIETAIMESSDMGWFAWKLIMPFASSAWNWFKASIRMSPLGLARGLINLSKIETRAKKMDAMFYDGKGKLPGELAAFEAKRDVGLGTIGTLAWILGAMLAGFGVIRMDEDDNGIPKLKIAGMVIDVSSIFGTSSALQGAALITGLTNKGWNWEGFKQGLNNMIDFTIDGMPLMQIIEMDMYANGGFDIGVKQFENIVLGFVPNIFGWIAGGTYSGEIDKGNFWNRLLGKIPFVPNLLPKKVNPYTGDDSNWWYAFNRFVPYISYNMASENEKQSQELGLNKTQLRGQYTVNDEEFNVTGYDLVEINKSYGYWNAIDLEKFYNDNMKVEVKTDNNKYKELKYSQMTAEQRKRAVNTIMSNNAELAKIMAWTKKGNKYYASANMYTKLRNRGIKSNVYRGTKGFVSK